MIMEFVNRKYEKRKDKRQKHKNRGDSAREQRIASVFRLHISAQVKIHLHFLRSSEM